jgi:DNA-binding PadR family transcriptional regulator
MPREPGQGFKEIPDEIRARRRERVFGPGDLRLVVLDLLRTRPRHGYEIIKAIEAMAGGDYAPSPGVIYPTLTLLEQSGHATATAQSDGKKQYGISPAGTAFLASRQDALQRIRGRVESLGALAHARRAPELQRAMQNFRTALHFRLGRGPVAADDLRKLAEAIDRAAIEIERS